MKTNIRLFATLLIITVLALVAVPSKSRAADPAPVATATDASGDARGALLAAPDVANAAQVDAPAPQAQVTVSVPAKWAGYFAWFINISGTVVIIARIIVKLTPTPKDDTLLEGFINVVKHLGLSVEPPKKS